MVATILMTDPEFYEVSYTINPWMKPEDWSRDPAAASRVARDQWMNLKLSLEADPAKILVIPGVKGLPDMVFPANAAIVLDGRALMARFRFPERRGEEAHFKAAFETLKAQGVISEIGEFPDDVFQEGAGDCLWDVNRSLFWAGWGPRSSRRAMDRIVEFFGQKVVGLELATERYYHLDTCFSVLSGGEILYYPEALSPTSRIIVEEMVPDHLRLVATADEAAAFSLNAVNLGRNLYMAPPPPRLAALLAERGYTVIPMALSNYLISGGGSFCMTLRLDRTSHRPG